jgi:hypothetical protein
MSRTLFALLLCAACDGGAEPSSGTDAADTDAAVDTDDTDTVPPAEDPSVDWTDPVELGPGEVFTGSFGAADPPYVTHFFRFLPPAPGAYTITLDGVSPVTSNWCDVATEFGCLCDATPPTPSCCTNADGAGCTFTIELTDADPTDVIVFPEDAVQGEYTIVVE